MEARTQSDLSLTWQTVRWVDELLSPVKTRAGKNGFAGGSIEKKRGQTDQTARRKLYRTPTRTGTRLSSRFFRRTCSIRISNQAEHQIRHKQNKAVYVGKICEREVQNGLHTICFTTGKTTNRNSRKISTPRPDPLVQIGVTLTGWMCQVTDNDKNFARGKRSAVSPVVV